MVEHQKFLIAKRCKPQVLGPICGSIQNGLLENIEVHPIFCVLLLKSVSHDALRPNQKHNSKHPPNLIHNESEFEVEVVFKSRQLRG